MNPRALVVWCGRGGEREGGASSGVPESYGWGWAPNAQTKREGSGWVGGGQIGRMQLVWAQACRGGKKKCWGLEFGGGASYLGSGDLMGWGKPRLRQWVCANGLRMRGE